MRLFNTILSVALLFFGILGLMYAFRMDSKKQKEIAKNGDIFSQILSALPLYLFKVVFSLMSLIPVGIAIGMWLQAFQTE
ncbi:hypothetical protein [Sporosarcina sp. BP05]|uniref:hypothetical protein n=1 Tax=Sporosarcina sp. BP05 TaxID=2758726 RepID=UPI001648018F|nr:hypothetical protein [Sporosarcina sp. BP05]